MKKKSLKSRKVEVKAKGKNQTAKKLCWTERAKIQDLKSKSHREERLGGTKKQNPKAPEKWKSNLEQQKHNKTQKAPEKWKSNLEQQKHK